MKRMQVLLHVWLLTASQGLLAHELHYATHEGQAVVIRMFYADGTPFAFESYEIFREGANLPYQIGRTDGEGRIAFLPDRAARWRIKAFSEDGHGLHVTLDSDTAGESRPVTANPDYERYGRIAVGVAIILGLYGFLGLYLKRKRPS